MLYLGVGSIVVADDVPAAGQTVFSKAASQSLLGSAAGSKIGDVYLNAPLTVVETQGDWTKVTVTGWVAKDSVAAKVAATSSTRVSGSSSLHIANYTVQQLPAADKKTKARIYLKLTVKNDSATPVKSWKSFLVAKNKQGRQLFITTVTDDAANIAPGGSKDISFVYDESEEPYDVLVGSDKNAVELSFEQLKVE